MYSGFNRAAIYLSAVLLTVFSSCQNQEGEIVARVYDHVLTMEDLQNMIPLFDENQDSVIIKQQYIDTWIAQKVLLHEAENALSRKEKKFDQQIAEYKQTLMIYAYENKQVNELLNRKVSEEEIADYYENHKNNFKLRQPIVKINYMVLPAVSQQIEAAKKLLFKSEKTKQELEKLTVLSKNHAVRSYLSDDWQLYDDIFKELPVENDKRIFEKNQAFELSDSLNVYLIKILDYKINEGYSPINIERENIIKSILQQRRIEILQSLKENAVTNAKEAGEVLVN